MTHMYLGRWISFYMDINDHFLADIKEEPDSLSSNQFYAGTKEEANFLTMKLIVEKSQESVHYKSIPPS
jgi:hypothetical protein